MMNGLTLLETRGNIHFAQGGLLPQCRSRAEVLGYRYRRDGQLAITPSMLPRLCETCVRELGIVIETSSDTPDEGA